MSSACYVNKACADGSRRETTYTYPITVLNDRKLIIIDHKQVRRCHKTSYMSCITDSLRPNTIVLWRPTINLWHITCYSRPVYAWISPPTAYDKIKHSILITSCSRLLATITDQIWSLQTSLGFLPTIADSMIGNDRKAKSAKWDWGLLHCLFNFLRNDRL